VTIKTTEAGWTEVGDRVFTKRFDPIDITVTAVVGADGVLISDTRCSLAEAREIKDEVRQLTTAPIRWVVNTHAHWDHVWGNAEFDAPRLVPPAEFWAHANVPQCFADPQVEEFKAYLAGQTEWAEKVAELELRAPDRLVETAHTLDLGDRSVELRHFGRGHTDGDLLLWVPDVRVLIAGDAVEESGPVAYGSDSFPLDWAGTLDAVAEFVDGDATIVPGHGDAVGIAFLDAQRAYVRAVAGQITELHGNGVEVGKALAAGAWPHADTAIFGEAVARGYAQLSGELA
jgi:glyoxylase-like metal-dependent hydrolase (beta-lactamase superfamily II)